MPLKPCLYAITFTVLGQKQAMALNSWCLYATVTAAQLHSGPFGVHLHMLAAATAAPLRDQLHVLPAQQRDHVIHPSAASSAGLVVASGSFPNRH